MTSSFCFSRIYEFGMSSVSVSCCYGVHLSLKKNGKSRQAEEGRNYKAPTPFCRCHDPYKTTLSQLCCATPRGISSVLVSCCYGDHLSLKRNRKAREEERNYQAFTPFFICHDPCKNLHLTALLTYPSGKKKRNCAMPGDLILAASAPLVF